MNAFEDERRLNHPFAKVFRNSFYLFVMNLATLAALFGFSVLLARSLGKETLGIYTLFTALLMPLTFFLDFGQSTALVQEIGQGLERRDRILRSSFFLKILLFLPATLTLLGLAFLYFDDRTSRIWFLLFAAILIPRAAYATFEAAMRALQRMRELMWIALITGVLLLAGTWLLLRGQFPFLFVLGWLVGVETFKAALIFWRYGRESGYSFVNRCAANDYRFAHDLARSALPFFSLGIIGILHDRLDVVLLVALRDVGDVGIYGAANNFVKVLRIAPSVIVAAFFPAITSMASDQRRVHEMSRRTLWLQVGASLILASSVFVLAEPLIAGTYRFAEAISVLRIAVWAVVPLSLYSTLIYVFFNAGRSAWNLTIVSSAVIVNLTANLILIPGYGAAALAWSSLISETFCCALFFIAYTSLIRAEGAGGIAPHPPSVQRAPCESDVYA